MRTAPRVHSPWPPDTAAAAVVAPSPALADCWVPDYCDPETFQYKLCRLRLRGRAKPGNQYACAEDEYCEEVRRSPSQPSASASAPPPAQPSQPSVSDGQFHPRPAVW